MADVVNSGCHGYCYGTECMCHMWVTYGSPAGTGMACAPATLVSAAGLEADKTKNRWGFTSTRRLDSKVGDGFQMLRLEAHRCRTFAHIVHRNLSLIATLIACCAIHFRGSDFGAASMVVLGW